MVWTVIAAVASLLAAACALATVLQTAKLRRDEHLRTLTDALVAMISATERNPGHGKDPAWDARVADAMRQVERAAGLSIIGLSARVPDSFDALLDPRIRDDPQKLFIHSTRAYQQLLAANDVRPIDPTNPDTPPLA